MDEFSNYVLAMFDVRGKQEYIYRSSKIKEIVGGSKIIEDIFEDYLYDIARDVTKKQLRRPDGAFSLDELIQDKKSCGEVVYDGGGDFLVIFKDEKDCRDIYYKFTKKVLEETGTLRILMTYVTGLNKDDFKGDRERLYRKHKVNENRDAASLPIETLPVVQADLQTGMPLTAWNPYTGRSNDKLTFEQKKKLEKFEKSGAKRMTGVQQLDDMTSEDDSLIAIVFIDGNGMGAMKSQLLENCTDYDTCANKMRAFSASIRKAFIQDREKLLVPGKMRYIIRAGEDFNLICNAHDVYGFAKSYVKAVYDSSETLEGVDRRFSCCAGIAVMHSHAPFSEAYRIAEELCESGKKINNEKYYKDGSFLDFHFLRSAIGIDLKTMRRDEDEENTSRPWLICGGNPDAETTVADAEKMRKCLDIFARNNVKDLLGPVCAGGAELDLELRRIISHLSDEKKILLFDSLGCTHNMNDAVARLEEQQTLMKDVILMYDLGFAEA